jgi:hypothetical protein
MGCAGKKKCRSFERVFENPPEKSENMAKSK